MIEIRDLCFQYAAEQPVLQDLNLDIREGEWITLIGANGSGKSTLARQLNGLLLPDSGTVSVDGLLTSDEEQLWEIRSRVAFVFQNPDNQLVATSVEDDIAFALENLGFPREEISQRVEGALSEMNLTALREKAPHLLSGGEKQRVAIAGALAMASKYLVLDEPTSMLDPSMRRSVIECLQKLHQEHGLAIIYITNIMEEALLADRVLVLGEGRVLRDEKPAALFMDHLWLWEHQLDIPQISYLAELLAERGHEQFRGVVSSKELVEIVCR